MKNEKNLLVVDLECTCTETDEFPREQMEIIEIGACILNPDMDIIGIFEVFVKPVLNPTLTSFCKQLTTITQEQVDNSCLVEEALKGLHQHASQFGEYDFVSWGGFDSRQIQRECVLKGIENPMRGNNINYKARFAEIKHLKNKRGVGVQKALNILGMKFIGTPHRGIDDARNIAAIIQKAGI